MIRILIILSAVLLQIEAVVAQHAYFPTQGTIYFEKVTYTKARMKEMMNKMGNQNDRGMRYDMSGHMSEMPESVTTNFVMQFDQQQTLMLSEEASGTGSTQMRGRGQGGRGGGRSGNMQMAAPIVSRGGRGAGQKTFYQNLKSKETSIQVELDEKYILKDSLQQVTWRFTDEYRNIAGYDCRRVNGATTDSLYLIAFYTDQIPVDGGPVLTGGLPGMILGLVIPEMHINYWATKVDFTNTPITTSWKDKKAKEITMTNFFDLLSKSVFSRGRANSQQSRRSIMENLIY
ncbi:GLPGLI family protein [Sphingobacterium sp. SYP-B4668]|uniref:GLPGLI family protein n=1 Tax=Sphingobacterium sp. SYP-B4668 TaxID=2996035 RepID=UPI0022DE5C5D|nr:GLPGLI family protein [Sphingobacterium sp. SYP-B4668]